MVGRSTRPLPGIVDSCTTPEERRESIARSQKPSCLVIDFVGNAGRHKLMTTADILGGKGSELAVKRVLDKAKAKGQALDMIEALDEEERRLRAEAEERRRREAATRAHVVARAQFSSREINPFDAFQLEPRRARGWDNKQLTPKQAGLLRRQGIDPDKLPFAQAKQLIGELIRRFNSGLCTMKQANLLSKHGYDTKDLKMSDASKLIDALAKNNWQRPDVAA
jgi:hypothetical protein